MADYGTVLAWQAPSTGRENKALEVFMEAQEMFEKAASNGLIDSFETVLLQSTGGGLPGGWTICWGSEDQIDAWARNEDYQGVVFKAGLVVEGLALTRAIRGDAISEGMGRYGQAINEVT